MSNQYYAIIRSRKGNAKKRVIIIFKHGSHAAKFLTLLDCPTYENFHIEARSDLQISDSEIVPFKSRLFTVSKYIDGKWVEVTRFDRREIANALCNLLHEDDGGRYRAVKLNEHSTDEKINIYTKESMLKRSLRQERTEADLLPKQLVGSTIGKWTLLKLDNFNRSETTWHCRCVCGAERVLKYTELRQAAKYQTGWCFGHVSLRSKSLNPLYQKACWHWRKSEGWKYYQDIWELVCVIERMLGSNLVKNDPKRYALRIIDPDRGPTLDNMYFFDRHTKEPILGGS